MSTELPPVTLLTPANTTTIRTTIKRSWKARALTIASVIVSFVLAVLGYLQTINLANFGLTADKALFYGSLIGLLQFILMQVNPVKLLRTEADPGSSETEGQ
jgi:hypothetical protein